MVGKEAVLHAIHAQVELTAAGGRCNGVGAGLCFAFFIGRYRRDELAGKVMKVLNSLNAKLEVVTLGNFRDAVFAIETSRKKLTCQVGSLFTGKVRRYRADNDYSLAGDEDSKATAVKERA
jgi:hypothetical protein